MKYRNDHGLLIDPETNTCAGYIFNFGSHGAYAPDGKLGNLPQAEIDEHNHLLAAAEWQGMLQHGRGMLYLSRDKEGKYYVSDWPGINRANVAYRRTSFHNFAGTDGRTDVWFYLDGSQWHGVNIGDSEICRVRRNKRSA